ncbi:MAG: hypothetical protein QG591_105 [Planctomycetota bacterium]|jgi:hypothetical protein|nr:hypothetical protein [Planctomycetota bacterium]
MTTKKCQATFYPCDFARKEGSNFKKTENSKTAISIFTGLSQGEEQKRYLYKQPTPFCKDSGRKAATENHPGTKRRTKTAIATAETQVSGWSTCSLFHEISKTRPQPTPIP